MAECFTGRISRHGLSLVHAPTSGVGRAVAHVIFIHGLFGHPEKTWTGPNPPKDVSSQQQLDEADSTTPPSSGVFWPTRLLPTAIPNINVHTWGYDADIDGFWSSASQNTVARHAASLLSDLADLLESGEPNVLPIIFVVHSLGGIVLKAALNQSSETKATRLSKIVDKVRGVIFLGTPHRGSNSASIGKHAYNITRIAGKRPNRKLLRALERHSDSLDSIGNSFLQTLAGHENIRIYSFSEEKETRKWVLFSTVVVKPDSAKIGLANEEVSSIPESHSNMTKYSLPSDIGFKRVVAQLKRWVKSIEDENSIFIDDCVRSLQSSETQLRFETVAPSHAKTFHWLYDTDEVSFSEWLRDSKGNLGSIYWIQGKPGSGKSTLMKFAILDARTRELLNESDGSSYILAGYFFHDRGKLIQKSIQGMLQSLLFSILAQSFGLRQFVRPFYTELVFQQQTKSVTWDFDALKNAFEAIVKQRRVGTRLCLFLDALDEHHGDNERLSHLMHSMAALADGDVVKVRLCLASRPWDTFIASFSNCLGFKIHEHTLKDIGAYSSGRLRDALAKLPNCGPTVTSKANHLDHLAEKISKRAQGVFIWVRIVVEQIATAVWERTPFIALETMLNDMPSELKDLYYHTLQRIDPRHAEESYIMLEIAWCALVPLTLETFANTTSYSLWKTVPKPGDESHEDMAQRIVSRSGGLLEVIHIENSSSFDQTDREYGFSDTDTASETGISKIKPKHTHMVQFCHQTAKEYVQEANGNFGLQRSETGGNGYEYLLAAASPSPRGWGKHMVDETFQYATLARKAKHVTSLKGIYDTLAHIFEAVNIDEWMRQKNLNFYSDLTRDKDVRIRCLALAAGLEISAAPSASPFITIFMWTTAMFGPPITPTKTPRRDMLQAVWDAYQPVSASDIVVNIPGTSYPVTALEAIVVAKLVGYPDSGDRLSVTDFLLSHGADPNEDFHRQEYLASDGSNKNISSISWPTKISSTLFMTCIKSESAPIIRLFGQHGARIPKEYYEPLRTMHKMTRGSSEVFKEVMRIIGLPEEELVKNGKEDMIQHFLGYHPDDPEDSYDIVQVGSVLSGMVAGVAIIAPWLMVGRSRNAREKVVFIFWFVIFVRRFVRSWRKPPLSAFDRG